MIVAGAAAQHHAPARVIAVFGAVGAVVAMAVAAGWAHDRRRATSGRQQR